MIGVISIISMIVIMLGSSEMEVVSNNWFDCVSLSNPLHVQTLMLTDAPTPFLGIPLVRHLSNGRICLGNTIAFARFQAYRYSCSFLYPLSSFLRLLSSLLFPRCLLLFTRCSVLISAVAAAAAADVALVSDNNYLCSIKSKQMCVCVCGSLSLSLSLSLLDEINPI